MSKNKDYKNVERGHQYALDIVSGKIVACVHIINSCKRYLGDLEQERNDPECTFYFSKDKAERFLKLAQTFKHIKGRWKTPNIVFEPWQCFVFMNVFGFLLHETGERRFRSAHVEVARGNGKSALMSICALYVLGLDNPKGNEVYSAATGKDQARIVFDSARAMARGNPEFLEHTGIEVQQHKLIHDDSNSFMRPLSSESTTLDGLIPALAVIDELHAHKNRGVFDVIDSAMSKRDDSLMFVITTAGFDTTNIGYSQSKYAQKIAAKEVEDETFFSMVYTLDEDDDPFDENNWIKPNPNWGISVDPKNFKSKALKAQAQPESLNNFLVKHLNVWTNAMSPYYSVAKWKELKSVQELEDFKGKTCFIGVDLASKIDICSFSIMFRDREFIENEDGEEVKQDAYYVFNKNFCPEATIAESNNELYPKWVKDGHLIATKGEAINYEKLESIMLQLSREYNIEGVLFDPWNATEFAQRMMKEDIEMIEMRMNTGNLSEPMKRLEALIRTKDIFHNGNGLDAWSLGNVVAKEDANDNVFPRKDSEKLKIDPIIAMIMALAGWLKDEAQESIYNERGIITF